MNPLTQSKNATILPVLIALTLGCLGLSPQARAVCQDGCLTDQNTVLGDDALFSLTTGTNNTALGFNALYSNTTGFENTANGFAALHNNTTGLNNTATGSYALYYNTSGYSNTATGWAALDSNTTGSFNTANGLEALISNTTGSWNTATGYYALHSNTTGRRNTANGVNALVGNTTGLNNTANGYAALYSNTTGRSNIALGFQAGQNLTTGDSNIDIGNLGVAGDSRRIRIGTTGTQTNTFVAGISGVTVAGGVGVVIDTNGHLGTVVSSARFKDNVQPMDKASEAILELEPVTFRYKHEFDPKGIPQFGLTAEDVEKVNPDLVAHDADGKAYTVRYDAVNAMLLNEFLKAHRKIEEQAHVNQQQEAINSMLESTVARQRKEIQALTTSLKEQASQIQKISEQIESRKLAPRLLAND